MDKLFTSRDLLHNAQVLYDFVDLFSSYENTVREYSFNEFLSMTEVHLLAMIENHPGVNSTELAELARRSKGFISQTINKLEKQGYLEKVCSESDAKKKKLYVTQKGKQLCAAHDDFDERMLAKTYTYLLRDCTPEEIAAFYKVMRVYNKIMMAAERKRRLQNGQGGSK